MPTSAELTAASAELARRVRAGDPGAAALLHTLYRDALLRFCGGVLLHTGSAEDAVQEILLKVLTSDPPEEHFRAWLFKLARNHCLNIRRGLARRPEQVLEDDEHIAAAPRTGPLTRLVRDERHARLAHLLGAMPRPDREVLHLRYVEGLTREEIATILDAPPALVKSRLHEALARLRRHAALLDSSLAEQRG